jgi:uncharacterized membrane protein YcaP (DUF421 family)
MDMDMGILTSFLEYLETALSFEPALILSIILRILIITGILLVIIKWLGSKGVGQLTTYQLIIILSVGDVVGDAMLNRETPIVIMIVALVIIIGVFKLLDYVSTKNRRLEKIINPQIISLVKNGNIDKEGMIKARIGTKEFESFMRLAGIRDINEIDISNLEINGHISFIKKDNKNNH